MNNKEKVQLIAVLFENLLKTYKTAFYFQEIKELDKENEKATKQPNSKLRKTAYKIINDKFKDLKAKIARTEKNNSELTKEYNTKFGLKAVADFLYKAQDFYGAITDIMIERYAAKAEGESINLQPAVLEESEKGNIFLEGKQYIIHVNILEDK